MPHRDRLTALDTSFLRLEAGGAHMHGAGINPYDGTLFLVGGDSAPSAIFWANMTAPTVWASIPN